MGGERKRDRLKRVLLGSSASVKRASGLEQTPSIASSSILVQRVGTNIETTLPDQVAESSLNSPKVQNDVRDLWADALQKLSDDDKAVLQSSSVSKLDVLEDLCAAAKRKRDECDNQRWKFEFNGRQIILHDIAEKIVVWINKFKEIVDIAVNFDPVHAALPWAGVRFLLQVRMEYLGYLVYCEIELILEKVAIAESQQMGALLVGVEKVTYLINRCKIYEILYLHEKTSRPLVVESPELEDLEFENLKLALLELYAAILQFLAKANRLYKSFGTRTLYGILNTDEVVGFANKCEKLENRVEFEVGNCDRLYNRRANAKWDERGERLKQLLVDLQEPIMRTDSRVAALYDGLDESERSDILNWLSSIQYEKNHRTAREGRTNGTGKWLLKHKRFRDWRGSSSSTILWLHGIRRYPMYSTSWRVMILADKLL